MIHIYISLDLGLNKSRIMMLERKTTAGSIKMLTYLVQTWFLEGWCPHWDCAVSNSIRSLSSMKSQVICIKVNCWDKDSLGKRLWKAGKWCSNNCRKVEENLGHCQKGQMLSEGRDWIKQMSLGIDGLLLWITGTLEKLTLFHENKKKNLKAFGVSPNLFFFRMELVNSFTNMRAESPAQQWALTVQKQVSAYEFSTLMASLLHLSLPLPLCCIQCHRAGSPWGALEGTVQFF